MDPKNDLAQGRLERWFRYFLLFMGVSFAKSRARHELSSEEKAVIAQLTLALRKIAAAANVLRPLLRAAEARPPVAIWSGVGQNSPLLQELRAPAFLALCREHLPEKMDNIYLSSRAGVKAACLKKPTLWSHGEQDTHRFPMHGLEHWRSLLAVPFDPDSTIARVEIGVPVLVEGAPAGSLICEISYAALRELADANWPP